MCRDFLGRPIDPGVLDGVLDAAFRGPSAGNTWALDLVVLEGGAQTGRYWDLTLPPSRRDGFRWPGLLRAPVLVLPYVDPAAYVRRYAEPDKVASGLGAGEDRWPVPYWFVDGGAAVMALLLAAEAAGLGALLFGQFDHEPAVRSAFGVPDGRRALGTIALGHPAPGGRRPSRSAERGRPDPVARRHAGRWGGGTGPAQP
jgi:nitroreductase